MILVEDLDIMINIAREIIIVVTTWDGMVYYKVGVSNVVLVYLQLQ